MIEIRNLTKRYGELVAVDDLCCTIEQGKIYGLLGANGAGKTTTMNMITGALAPSSGSVTVCGKDISIDPLSAKRHIGYLPEIPPLYPDMTVREYLRFVAEAKSVAKGKRARALTAVMEQTGLIGTADRLIRNLSKGYCQRIGIAQALLGDPDILILDEPTVGLDPRQIVEIRDLIRKLAKTHTVILSSHILSEVSELCDTILILSSGKLAAMDSLDNLQKRFLVSDRLQLSVKCAPQKCEDVLRQMQGILKSTLSPKGTLTEITLECTKGNDLREALFFAFAAIRCPIIEMHLQEASLEEVFLCATKSPVANKDGASLQAPVGRREKSGVPQSDRRSASKSHPAPTPVKPRPTDDDDDDDYTPLFGRKEKRE